MTALDPIVETAEIQRMINASNIESKDGRMLEIKRTVFYTGYLIQSTDTDKLLTLVKLPQSMQEKMVKFLANNILITFGPAQTSILSKAGGIGHKQTWQVTGFGVYGNNVWAARVAPVPPISSYHTDNQVPFVLLAHHKSARPNDANRISNWQPVSADKQYIFQTTVGEKVQLRVEPENGNETEYDSLLERPNLKRRHSPASGDQQQQRGVYGNDENRRPTGTHGGHKFGGNQNRGRGIGGGGGGGSGRGGGGNNNNNINNRGGKATGGGRGGAGGGGGGNRQRGGGQRGYKVCPPT